MRIITDFREIGECAVCLGNFDGLHKAHMKIIDDCTQYANTNGILGGLLLFKNHTSTICKSDNCKLITTLEEKIEILEKTGIDFVFLIDFDEKLMKNTPDEFFVFLKDKIKAKALFAGYDYRFGYKAQGDIKKLIELGEQNGVYVNVCGEITEDDEAVSSTRIRKLICDGDIKNANRLLTRPHFVLGEVCHGKKNGRKMGLPTANVSYSPNKLLPPDGVYFGFTEIEKKVYKSLVNIGKNPTFDAKVRTIESHIIGYDKEIYTMSVKVGFLEKIRDEIRFSSVDELIEQIKRDIEYVERKEICI